MGAYPNATYRYSLGDLTSAHQVAALPHNWPYVLAYHMSTSSFVFPDAEDVTSSANIVVVSRYGCSGRSFIRIKKSIGPKMVPCGTPVLTIRSSEVVEFI